MKGFIEVKRGSRSLVNIKSITRISLFISGSYKCKLFLDGGFELPIEETYDQIKQLIKEAQ